MFVTGRRALAALAAVALVAGLAGCSSGGSKPTSLPSLTANTSLSPTPTSTSDQLAEVSAVVHRYFELVSGPTTTEAANELLAMMTPACKCRRVAQSIRDAAQKGERYYGTTIITSFVPNIDGRAAADVLLDYDASRSGMRDRSGRTVHSYPARKNMSADFRLVKVNGSWLIDIVEIIRDGTPA